MMPFFLRLAARRNARRRSPHNQRLDPLHLLALQAEGERLQILTHVFG
jgi:hypothetical protein